ncbi:hypothetical protein ABU162_22940 [Paenibacillus thiaminolyticus]|uniref:hypothetical protein n=1 Tax=Paenibacillus thiaminolyticus TaxID=49283 RepID=UPI0035A71063
MSMSEILQRNNIKDYSGRKLDSCPCCKKEYVWKDTLKHGGAVLGYERKKMKCPGCGTEIALPKSVEAACSKPQR